MLRDVFLHGALGRRFGRRWQLDVASPAEAVRALCTLRPELTQMMRAGWWRVIVGPPHISNAIELQQLCMNAGAQAIHLVPATMPRGEDVANVGKIIVGVALVAVGVLFAQGYLIAPGLSLIFGGVAGLLTPKLGGPQPVEAAARPEDRPSFLFAGVTNNTVQGAPVPVVMGTHLVGSILVAGSINASDIAP